MTTPATYAITIYINDVDVTQYVPFDSISFDDHRTQVSSWRMTVYNPSGVVPTRGHEVRVIWNATNEVQFNGYIIERITRKRDNGVVLEYDLECADRKILLQKAIVPYFEFSGADSSIITGLFSQSYPDLSAFFDFATDVTSFADGLFLNANETSLLDLLNELAEKAGADYRLENVTETEFNVTFDAGGYAGYTASAQTTMTASVQSGGNPNNCYRGVDADPTPDVDVDWNYIEIEIDLGASIPVTGVTLDYYGTEVATFITVTLKNLGSDVALFASGNIGEGETSVWHTWDLLTTYSLDAIPSAFGGGTPDNPTTSLPGVADTVVIRHYPTGGGGINHDIRLDNILVTSSDGEAGKTKLVWDSTPDSADFNIDVQAGDEYASNIDLYDGDWDDYNSVTVIGKTEEAIDWTYESDGDLNHINLETEIRGYAIYQNDGTDGTPNWTLLDDGIWGEDVLTVFGGDKDVLYDPNHHWLYLNANAPALSKSIRVTGNIMKPIRIRVENVPSGQPTYATSIIDNSITSIDDAVTIANAALGKRSEIKRLEFDTKEPGLKVGQLITVADSARGLNETLIIQQISTKWLGPSGHAQFHVLAGDDENSGIDSIIANNDKRSRDNADQSAPTTQTANFLTDDSDNLMTDDSGNQLYEVV